MKLTEDFKEVIVKPALFGYGPLGLELPTTKFNKPYDHYTYVRILHECSYGVKSARDLFPKVKYPMMAEVRDMCRRGLLKRYVNLNIRNGHKYFYGTTESGKELIKLSGKRTMLQKPSELSISTIFDFLMALIPVDLRK